MLDFLEGNPKIIDQVTGHMEEKKRSSNLPYFTEHATLIMCLDVTWMDARVSF